MAGLGQGGDRDIGDVVDIDDRLGHVSAGRWQHAGHDGIAQIALSEVLREPRGADEGKVDPGIPHDVLAQSCVMPAPPGQQHEVFDAGILRGLHKRAEPFDGDEEREVREKGDVSRAFAAQRRRPGFGRVPVEGRGGASRPRRTEWPLASSLAATRAPVFPVAPITRMGFGFMVFLLGLG